MPEEENSDPSYPISPATYCTSITSYSSVLQKYIRNFRFNESATPKPQLIIKALHVSHIQAAVVCGTQHGLQIKIRSGGHDYEGFSYVSDAPHFFVLDMFNFRAMDINVEDETAWIKVGATLGEMYYRIDEKRKVHGFPAGVCATLGVGCHFSEGGYGAMMRKYGLSVDNILDAQLVDVNGQFLDWASMGEHVFWAITEGGGASFGAVVAYNIRLGPVPPKVTGFWVERSYNRKADDIPQRRQKIAHKFPEEFSSE